MKLQTWLDRTVVGPVIEFTYTDSAFADEIITLTKDQYVVISEVKPTKKQRNEFLFIRWDRASQLLNLPYKAFYEPVGKIVLAVAAAGDRPTADFLIDMEKFYATAMVDAVGKKVNSIYLPATAKDKGRDTSKLFVALVHRMAVCSSTVVTPAKAYVCWIDNKRCYIFYAKDRFTITRIMLSVTADKGMPAINLIGISGLVGNDFQPDLDDYFGNNVLLYHSRDAEGNGVAIAAEAAIVAFHKITNVVPPPTTIPDKYKAEFGNYGGAKATPSTRDERRAAALKAKKQAKLNRRGKK